MVALSATTGATRCGWRCRPAGDRWPLQRCWQPPTFESTTTASASGSTHRGPRRPLARRSTSSASASVEVDLRRLEWDDTTQIVRIRAGHRRRTDHRARAGTCVHSNNNIKARRGADSRRTCRAAPRSERRRVADSTGARRRRTPSSDVLIVEADIQVGQLTAAPLHGERFGDVLATTTIPGRATTASRRDAADDGGLRREGDPMSRLLTPLAVIALGVLLLLQGLEEITPPAGIAGGSRADGCRHRASGERTCG